MIRSAGLFLLLCALWLLLSGFFTPFLLTAGAACALSVVWFTRRMDGVEAAGPPMRIGVGILGYLPWLSMEIVKSAWAVSKIILDPRLPISPTLVRFRPAQTTELGLVIHANSITLTPGTITIEATADEFLVHGLTRGSAAGVPGSEMDRRVAAVEGVR
ncbi:MAG: Na+/H+ antiporter subunit E [Caldimonas sp.]